MKSYKLKLTHLSDNCQVYFFTLEEFYKPWWKPFSKPVWVKTYKASSQSPEW